ncbi:MAG TPA: hypothetical protein DHW49_01385 [Anaerolineae bacterium]|nr:hypothetical protein [Anaerolineae bacterium]
MRKTNYKNYLLIFLISLITIGCVPSTTTPQVYKFTPTPFSPVNTKLITPTLDSTPFQLIPTLTKEESRIEVEDLLTQTSDCKLPCWWDIIPGLTLWGEVDSFLIKMNAPFLEFSETQTTHYASELGRPEIDYSLSMEIIVDKNLLVNNIVITSLDIFNLEKFQNIWKNYQPLQILKTYGIPSRIWLETGGIENNNLLGGMLFLFYDEKGFLITYPIIGEVNQEYYQFCPGIGTQINLFMRSLDSPATLNFLAKDLISPDYIDILEEATGKTIEEIYFHIIKTGCFETHKNIGP